MSATVLAFMQNQWLKNPEPHKRFLAKFPELRHASIKRLLFYKCKSGRVLKQTFGDLCDLIVWEETTTEIADNPHAIYPADLKHMAAQLLAVKPAIIVTFGTHARNAVEAMMHGAGSRNGFTIINAMHPAARHPNVIQSLHESARQLREAMN